MVSFSCENCGDVLTKKKLDGHRNQCRGASFTCLDCMVHFQGTEYRSHTSCISEAQKYQGALYKEKPNNKNQNRKQNSNQQGDSSALVPRQAYVEDVPDGNEVPPAAPSPPPNPPLNKAGPVNVFDFLVPESPSISQVSLPGKSNEQMTMKKGAPSVFTDSNKQIKRREESDDDASSTDSEFEENGYSYGAQPVKPSPKAVNGSMTSLDFKTPTAKSIQRNLKERDPPSHKRSDSGNMSDRKRKRGHVDPLDLSATHNSQETVRFELEGDTVMRDMPSATTPAGLTHSGLTGGLNRLLSDSTFPPSPDYSDEKERTNLRSDPTSPLKRSKHSKDVDSNGLGISIKGRAGRIMSLMGVAATPITTTVNNERALVRTRRRASSSESGQHGGDEPQGQERERRPRKHHRVHRVSSSGTHASSQSHHRSSRRHSSDTRDSGRKLKAIEYHYPSSNSDDSDGDDRQRSQLVKYDADAAALAKNRTEHFLSFINKGPDSERGVSMNKCLKRWHRDNASASRGRRELKISEEKELFKGLRLRKNDRGEVVIFF